MKTFSQYLQEAAPVPFPGPRAQPATVPTAQEDPTRARVELGPEWMQIIGILLREKVAKNRADAMRWLIGAITGRDNDKLEVLFADSRPDLVQYIRDGEKIAASALKDINPEIVNQLQSIPVDPKDVLANYAKIFHAHDPQALDALLSSIFADLNIQKNKALQERILRLFFSFAQDKGQSGIASALNAFLSQKDAEGVAEPRLDRASIMALVDLLNKMPEKQLNAVIRRWFAQYPGAAEDIKRKFGRMTRDPLGLFMHLTNSYVSAKREEQLTRRQFIVGGLGLAFGIVFAQFANFIHKAEDAASTEEALRIAKEEGRIAGRTEGQRTVVNIDNTRAEFSLEQNPQSGYDAIVKLQGRADQPVPHPHDIFPKVVELLKKTGLPIHGIEPTQSGGLKPGQPLVPSQTAPH